MLSRRGARAIKMRLSAVSSSMRGSGARNDAVRLRPKQAGKDLASRQISSQVVQNLTPAEQLRWALACPEVEAHHFDLTVEDESVGSVICYVRQSWGGLLGTVVHIPHLGSQRGVWSAAIGEIERFFFAKGCSRITVMASDQVFAGALLECGFASDRILPFWFRGHNDLPTSWHLTLLEGDLAYRK
jgi:hypothetical protein